MRTNKNLIILVVLLFECLLLARGTNGSLGEPKQGENATEVSGKVRISVNRATGNSNKTQLSINTDHLTSSNMFNVMNNKMTDNIVEPSNSVSSKTDGHLYLGDPGAFETDLSTAEGMEHMHIMKKKPKYKKVKMEVLEPKIKYKKIKMKYKKPVKKMKKKKVKGYIKAEKSKMKKMKHYEHHA